MYYCISVIGQKVIDKLSKIVRDSSHQFRSAQVMLDFKIEKKKNTNYYWIFNVEFLRNPM
jgi:hypothetical protein